MFAYVDEHQFRSVSEDTISICSSRSPHAIVCHVHTNEYCFSDESRGRKDVGSVVLVHGVDVCRNHFFSYRMMFSS